MAHEPPSYSVIAKPKAGKVNKMFEVLYGHIEEISNGRIVVHELSLRALFTARPKIFHFHWPDLVFNRQMFVATVMLAGFAALLTLLKVQRVKIVWTVHNPIPKGQVPGKMLLKFYNLILLNFVDYYVFPSKLACERWSRIERANTNIILRKVSRDYKRSRIILHGLQYDLKSKGSVPPPEITSFPADYILIVGRLAVEKNLEDTLKMISRDRQLSGIPVIVAGQPDSAALLERLRSFEADLDLLIIPRKLSDEEINHLITKSKFVLIDYFVTNSGVAALAATHNALVVFKDEELEGAFRNDYRYPNSSHFRDRDGQLNKTLFATSQKKEKGAPAPNFGLVESANEYVRLFDEISR